MLQAIRTRAGSIIVKALFAVLILLFGFWGISTRSTYFQSHTPETEIATVGDQTIRIQDLQALLQPALERLRAQFGSTPDKQQIQQLGLVDTLVGQLVDRSLLDQEAERLRLDVSDEVIRSAITNNPGFHDANGKFDRGLFAQVLAMNHLSEDQLVNRLRHDIPRTDILHAATSGIVPPDSVAAALYRFRNEKRIADIVAIPLAAAGDVGTPSDADLAKFYDSHQDLFRAPEYRGFTMVSLSPADLAKKIDISEATLRKEYDERKDDFVTPEHREVQQILAPSEDKAKAAEAALAAGKDWNEVATTIAGQAPDTIDLGLLKREEMPHVLADAAFALPLNQPSEPIKSPLGWHILRVVKIEPPATLSFAEAKPKLQAELAQEEALDRLDKLGNKVDDALAGGASLDEVAAKFGLTKTAVAASDVGGRDPEGRPVAIPGSAAEVLKVVFGTEQGEVSRVVTGHDGDIFAVRTDKVTQPRVKRLDEVKDQAIAAWQAERKREAVAAEAKDLAAAVKSGTPLAALAADKKLTLTTSPPLSRRAEPGDKVSPVLISKLFAAKPGEAVTAEDAGGAYVAVLKEVKVPEAPNGEAAKRLDGELTAELKLDVATEFTEALRARYPVKLYRDAIDRAY